MRQRVRSHVAGLHAASAPPNRPTGRRALRPGTLLPSTSWRTVQRLPVPSRQQQLPASLDSPILRRASSLRARWCAPHLGQGLPRRLCAGVLRQVHGTPEALQLVDVLPVARMLGSRLGQQPHVWRVLAATSPGRAGGLKLSSARQVHAGVASLAPARAPRLQAQGTVALFSDSRAVYFRSDRGPAVRPDGRVPYRWQVGQRVGEAGEWYLTTGWSQSQTSHPPQALHCVLLRSAL